MTKLNKKIISLSLAAIMGMTLVACGGNTKKADEGTTPAPPTETVKPTESAEPVTLRFSWWGGDDRHEATLAAIQEFEVEHPNIKVEAEYGGWSGWQEKITTQILGKQEADLMQVNWNWLYLFSKNGDGFYNINELSDQIDLANYSPEVLEGMTIKGNLNGIPVSTTGRIFVYNEAIYEKAGVAIPESFADLYAAGAVFKEKLGDDYYPLAGDRYTWTLLWRYYLEQKYGKEWIVDNKLNYTQEELVDGYNFMLGLEEKHVIPGLKAIASGGAADAVENDPKWIDGHYAGTYEWDSAVAKWEASLAEGKLVLGKFPTDLGPNKSAISKISLGFSISKNTKHPVEAAMLLSYLVEKEAGVKTLGLSRGIVSNKAAIAVLEGEGKLEGLNYEGNKAIHEFAGFGFDPNFEATNLRDDLYKALSVEVSYGETTPEDAAAKIIETVNAYNEEYPIN